ncbi:MAG: tRNA dihydrouridine synthase DusB, partial [Firmicutes bacterium]|nr:tRNA dihydrouridine synthase DusB [Bacillota bacterium]
MYDLLGMSFDSPMVLAPLAGISDSVFRRLAREQGASLSYTEMVSAKGLYYRSPGTEELLHIEESEGPVGVQLFGSEPDMIAFAADKLRGRPNVLIDLNMGCPVPKVVKNGEGSAMLLDPDNAARCVEAAAKNAGKPVTVKMRIGFEGKDGVDAEHPYDYVGFARLMERAGASVVTVHARTRQQYYSGKANWKAVAEISDALSVPVIGNGDVKSAQDARRMLSETGCSLVMIGRAALGDPWVFAEWKDPQASKRHQGAAKIAEMMRRHFELLRELKGDYTALMEMRKHFGWYTKGIRGAAELRRQVNTAQSADELIE